jgi:hypothetical protein
MIALRKIAPGKYATLDGRFLIDQQPYERECECVICQGGWGTCRGGGWATDWFWCIWDVERDDYMEGTHFSSFATLREAREHLTPNEVAAMRER